jgi:hypothetical protein
VEQAWEITADTRDLIALSAVGSTFQDGSAHGYYGFRKMIWGKAARRPLSLGELFSDERGPAELMSGLCARLNSARAERLRERGGGGSAAMACPVPDDASIVPIADNGKIRSFRMMLTGDETPGGYAEGSYEIEAPVTAGLAALIAPAFRDSFNSRRHPGASRDLGETRRDFLT